MNWPARHPVAAIVIAVLALAASIVAITRLHADSAMTSFFSPDDPAANALAHVMEHYAVVDEIQVLVTVPTEHPDIARLTAFADRLVAAIDGDPASRAMVSEVSFRADDSSRKFVEKVLAPSGLYYLSDEDYAKARQRLTLDAMKEQIGQNEAMVAAPGPAATALAKEFLKDPLRLHEFLISSMNRVRPFKGYQGSDAFLSPDGRSLLIRIAGAKPMNDMTFSREISAAVYAAIDRAKPDGLQVDVTGAYAIAARSQEIIRQDTIGSVIGSVALIAIVFFIAYKRPVRLFTMAILPLGLGAVYAFGLYAGWSDTITPLTAVAAGILAGMGDDFTIEYLSHYYHKRTDGLTPVAACDDTIRSTGAALLAGCVTSLIGFVAIGFSSVRALRDFAIIGGLGLVATFIASLWVLPALLVLMDRKPAGSSITAQRLSIKPLIGFIERHARGCKLSVLLIAAVLLVFACTGRSPFELESDLTILHPRPNPPLEAEDFVSKRMGFSPGSLLVHVRADTPEQHVALAHAVRRQLDSEAARQVGITGTLGIATLLPDPQTVANRRAEIGQAMADRVTADFDRAIEDSAFSAEAYAPYRKFLQTLLTDPPVPQPADLLPYHQIAGATLPRTTGGVMPNESIIMVQLSDPLTMREPRAAATEAVQKLIKDIPGATLTGMAVLSQQTEVQIRRDLPRLMGFSILMVCVYLLIHFRSITHMFLSIVPLILSLIAWAAMMKITGMRLNMANIAALPLLMGINTDYGIFLVSHALHHEGQSLRTALTASAQAIVLCAITTFFGFGSLAYMSVPAIRSLGWSVAIGISTCVLASLFLLLPILLRKRLK